MKVTLKITLLILGLFAASAFAFQAATQPDTSSPLVTPTAEQAPGAEATPTFEAASTSQTAAGETALVWQGDPLTDDNQEECSSLQLTAAGQAIIGPCGAADIPAELLAGPGQEWPQLFTRFAPFTLETDQGLVEFKGQGQISSPAWQRAIATWSQFTYNELASGRVSASGRTVMSWFLGELPEQPGSCRHLVVLSYGYAYSNITPCAGGNVQETAGGWLDTSEWEKFDTWLYGRAQLYQDNNYFAGQGQAQMSQADAAALAEWAEAIYTRLRNEHAPVAATTPQAEDQAAAGCPEPAAGTSLLQNPEHGYCLLYPATYTVEKPNENETVLVVGSLLNVADPRVHIEVSEAAGRAAAEVAGQLEAEASIPGLEVKRSSVTIGGEEAIVLDNLPGQDINRRVLLVHEGRLYNLMFAPASSDAGEVYERMEELYSLIVSSFTFLPQE